MERNPEETGSSSFVRSLVHFIPLGVKDQPGVWSCEAGMGIDRPITSFLLLHNVIGLNLMRRTKC